MNNNIRRKEQEFTYEELIQIKDHAKRYDFVSDKKEFLKNISPYEQKLVLLESKNPYEVLNYLEELDLPNTKLILDELNLDEILKVLELFSAEDKKKFYNGYSDLTLVNQFIAIDENASQHIENIDIDRKIELLNSSDANTLSATSKVYESISDEEKIEVVQNVTSIDGRNALSDVVSDSDVDLAEENIIQENEIESETKLPEIVEEQNETELELEKNENLIEEEQPKEIKDDFKIQQEKTTENEDFSINKETSENDILNDNILQSFQMEKINTEIKEIEEIKSYIENNNQKAM